MKISIEKKLNFLEDYFTGRGYEIVPEGTNADAYIYYDTPISQIPAKNFSPVSSLASDPLLLISAKEKKPEEIELILKQKSYNKIF